MNPKRISLTSLFAAFIAILVGFNAIVIFSINAFFPNVSIFPWMKKEETQQTAPNTTPSTIPVAKRSGALPAQTVIDKVLKTPVPAVNGWNPVTPVANVSSTPFDVNCDASKDVAPALSGSTGWIKNNVNYSVNIRAYSAGLGGQAIDSTNNKINNCAYSSSQKTVSNGAETLMARTGKVSMMAVRRGDVIITLVGQNKGAALTKTQMLPVIEPLDKTLMSALQGVCVEVDSLANTYTRSPFSGSDFTGNIVKREVEIEATNKPLPSGVKQIPIPSRKKDLPDTPWRPEAPEAPITPAKLPDEVPSPQAPEAPTPSASTGEVNERVADDKGPGCGWAFTGQTAVEYDANVAAAQYKADYDAMHKTLTEGWNKWQQERQQYFMSYAEYDNQAEAYIKYAQNVEKTRVAWNTIRSERQQFIDAWRAYVESISRRDSFINQQKAAEKEYASKLQFCRTAPPVVTVTTPKPIPSKTTSTVIETPNPAVTTGPDGSPSPAPMKTTKKVDTIMITPPASTSTSTPAGCPATQPAILTQAPPEVHKKPTPPSHMPPDMLKRVTGGN